MGGQGKGVGQLVPANLAGGRLTPTHPPACRCRPQPGTPRVPPPSRLPPAARWQRSPCAGPPPAGTVPFPCTAESSFAARRRRLKAREDALQYGPRDRFPKDPVLTLGMRFLVRLARGPEVVCGVVLFVVLEGHLCRAREGISGFLVAVLHLVGVAGLLVEVVGLFKLGR